MESILNFLNYLFLFSIVFSTIWLITSKKGLPAYPFYILFFLVLGNLGFTPEHNFLKPDFNLVYEILLPIILFESAINIDIHRFRLQFKTLNLLTTAGLLLNAIFVSLLLNLIFQIPFQSGILFGILISATDPIGVLALVKNLKIPSRLKLIIEGESLLNDAATVIFFELALALFLLEKTEGIPNLLIVKLISNKFLFSILIGTIFGITLSGIARLLKRYSLLNNLLIFLLATTGYIYSEKFGLSGPIFIIFAGIIFGNFSYPYLEEKNFEKKKYFFSLLVLIINIYFFAIVPINTDIDIHQNPIRLLTFIKINFVILLARTLTIYLTLFFTNKYKFFLDEPDIYTYWQHIINASGLRGIIPLILVDQLPKSFLYKNLFYEFTIYTFVFTNLVNPFIVLFLIKKFEKLFYSQIFKLKKKLKELLILTRKLQHLKEDLQIIKNIKNVNKEIINIEVKKTNLQIKKIFNEIKNIKRKKALIQALHLLGASIEKKSHLQAYKEKRLSYYDLILLLSELDLQIDALLYPEKFANRVINEKGLIIHKKSWRMKFYEIIEKFHALKTNKYKKDLINLYWERIISSVKVIEEFKNLFNIPYLPDNLKQSIKEVKKGHLFFIKHNFKKLNNLLKNNIKQNY